MAHANIPQTKPYKLALHIFRRDFRLKDNTGLIHALQQAEKVIPCFIFDPRQIEENPYKSNHAITFMIHSLCDLIDQLIAKGGKLYLFYGIAHEVVTNIIQKIPIDLVTYNKDYTPFSQLRDQYIQNTCQTYNIDCHASSDILLNEPETIHKKDGSPYTVFTPFFNHASMFHIATPHINQSTNYYNEPLENDKGKTLLHEMLPPPNKHIALQGGRKEAKKLLHQIISNHTTCCDIPRLHGTSHLSAHHKFGTISIRETYHALKNIDHTHYAPVRQLYWRDFFVHIAYHFPHIWHGPFHKKYIQIPWSNHVDLFEKWCHGETGFPIIDAGMKELNTTGYIHNRIRMITASFLVKHLHINWQWGEHYFAQQLIDYDPAVNNGNWQWVASTGCDAQPYFRIFNPWLQQAKFDPQCTYIKKWLPQLYSFSPKQLHNLYKVPLLTKTYPKPIVDHATAVNHTKKIYQIIRNIQD